MDKKQLSEREICTQYITPAIAQSGWDIATQVREEFALTAGRIIVRGKLHTRGQRKRADYVLFYKPNIPIAVVEAKRNDHAVGDGMQQGLGYAVLLEVPFVFSSNGDRFLFHTQIETNGVIEREPPLDASPSITTALRLLIQIAVEYESKAAASSESPVFFTDECLGRRVPQKLREAGLNVWPYFDSFKSPMPNVYL